MDPFENEHIGFFKLQIIALIFTLTNLEIKARELYFLTVKKIGHVLIEALYIYGVEAFKVIIAVLILGRILAIFEIIVYLDRMRSHPVSTKLYRESVGEGRLAG